MKLSWSIGARNRRWSKAMRRIRPQLKPLIAAFEGLELDNTEFDVILIGVMDELPAEYLKEVPNSDRFFQVTIGFDPSIGLGVENDQSLAVAFFHQLSRAILSFPFAAEDKVKVRDLLGAWATNELVKDEER